MSSILLKTAKIVDSGDDYDGLWDIFIKDGVISEINRKIDQNADETIYVKGLTVIPGLVDIHTHLREPGFEYKETVRSGTAAAAKGGYTTVCCMPNTNPTIDNVSILKRLQEIIKTDALINTYPICAVTIKQGSRELADMDSLYDCGCVAFSDDGRPVLSAAVMRDALNVARDKGYVVIDHCEELSLAEGGVINEGLKSKELGLKGIPGLSEELMIMRDIMLAEELDAPVHIAHISTAKSAKIISEAKTRGVKVTCEVTPHHLSLTEDIITAGFTDCKVNPPLRTEHDVLALKHALVDGTIDLIATDHAPHSTDDKTTDFYKAANGISNIEHAFSICYTELVEKNYLSLKELVVKMSLNPSSLLGLKSGKIGIGQAGNLAIIDVEKDIIISKEAMLSKGKNTPFHTRKYTGEVIYTICNGKIVYKKEAEK